MARKFKTEVVTIDDIKYYKNKDGDLKRYSDVSKHEIHESASAIVLGNQAYYIQKRLLDFKEKIFKRAEVIHKRKWEASGMKKEYKPLKNFTFFSLDGNVKIQVKQQLKVSFDDTYLEMAQSKFMQFLSDGLSGASSDFLREMILDAFMTNSKGHIDKAKVDRLLSYRHKTDNADFLEAAELLDKAKKITGSKQYVNVYERNEQGGYDYINLNLSAV